jgi:hypothetical protein
VFHVAGLAPEPGTLTGNCGDNPGIACRLTWDITHSTNATQLVRVYLAGPVTQALRILFVILIALLVRAVAHRVINKITERAATTSLPVAAVAIRPGGRRRASAAPSPADDTTAISAAAVAVAGTERRARLAQAHPGEARGVGGPGAVQPGSDHAHRGQDRAHAAVGGGP